MIEIKNAHTYKGPGVWVERTHGSPLQNWFYMHNESERDKVCDQYLAELRIRYKRGGAEKNELIRLATIYKETNHLILICWCAPKRCHAQSIAQAVKAIALTL
jgi:hypothetical protein